MEAGLTSSRSAILDLSLFLGSFNASSITFLNLVLSGSSREESSVRIVVHRVEETVDDSADLGLGVVEMSSHAHHHRLFSIKSLIQLQVCNLDGVRVQDGRAVGTSGRSGSRAPERIVWEKRTEWSGYTMRIPVLGELKDRWRRDQIVYERKSGQNIDGDVSPRDWERDFATQPNSMTKRSVQVSEPD
jgi:hypothetical protein